VRTSVDKERIFEVLRRHLSLTREAHDFFLLLDTVIARYAAYDLRERWMERVGNKDSTF
jgi:hypothetical protein